MLAGIYPNQITVEGDRLYTSRGDIIDTKTQQLLHQGPLAPESGNSVVTEPALQRRYLLYANGSVVRLEAFGLNSTFSFGKQLLPLGDGPTQLIRWGSDGFAYSTPVSVVILRSTLAQ